MATSPFKAEERRERLPIQLPLSPLKEGSRKRSDSIQTLASQLGYLLFHPPSCALPGSQLGSAACPAQHFSSGTCGDSKRIPSCEG